MEDPITYVMMETIMELTKCSREFTKCEGSQKSSNRKIKEVTGELVKQVEILNRIAIKNVEI